MISFIKLTESGDGLGLRSDAPFVDQLNVGVPALLNNPLGLGKEPPYDEVERIRNIMHYQKQYPGLTDYYRHFNYTVSDRPLLAIGMVAAPLYVAKKTADMVTK